MKTLQGWILALQEILLCWTRKWWRPITYFYLATATLVNTVIIPLKNWTPVSLTEFAALIASWSPIIAIRAWEKQKEGE